MLFDITVLLQL